MENFAQEYMASISQERKDAEDKLISLIRDANLSKSQIEELTEKVLETIQDGMF